MEAPLYKIYYVGDNYYINTTKIPNKIFDKEKSEYRFEDRDELIDNLIRWISECTNNDKQLMKDDLKELMNIDDEYILSSISTNSYLYGNSDEFNAQCEEILKLVK